jgi:hypothetical protein
LDWRAVDATATQSISKQGDYTSLYLAKDDELCRSVGHSDVGSPTSSATPTNTKSNPIGAIVGGVNGGVVVLLGAICFDMAHPPNLTI